MPFRPSAISLSPNTTLEDAFLAIRILFSPSVWKGEKNIREIEAVFKKEYGCITAKSFNSGRSALLALLHSYGIGKGDEVIVQSFTCVAVPDVVLWSGAKPVYADIDDTLNIDPIKLEKRITPKTKAVIVQHTFGVPANLYSIKKITRKHNLLLIEDCAHSLGNFLGKEKLGSLGDCAFFSFGRDKMISSVFGGMAIINKDSGGSVRKLEKYHFALRSPSARFVLQQLFHPILFNLLILPLYRYQLGKVILALSLKFRILGKPVLPMEKHGKKPDIFPMSYHNCLAALALRQMSRLPDFRKSRIYNTKYYSNSLKKFKGIIRFQKGGGEMPLLRFAVFVKNPSRIIKKAKENGIVLGNWYSSVIDPKGVDFDKIGYRKGMCPEAEKYASRCLNLPTYPYLDKSQIREIVRILEGEL